jgi:ribosomal protein S18 acetylase RimI-like enzyme
MNALLRIQIARHAQRDIARRIHEVQMLAYAQEAALLGARWFPPLEQTIEDVMASPGTFYAALIGDEIVGALAVSQEAGDAHATIDSLVVSPAFQRQGAGRALLEAVIAEHGRKPLFVQTGAKNVPALSLYARYGFREIERWLAGDEPLELVRLRRAHCTIVESCPDPSGGSD